MSTIIIFASRYGTVEKCSQKLKELLKDNTTVYNIKDVKKIKDLNAHDTIIMGCSVHAGKIQGKMKKFFRKNLPLLMKKKTGLFLCTLTPPDKAGNYFQTNFPEQLVQNSLARGLFGGELIYENMNAIEQFILKKISKRDKSESFLKQENIEKFAEQMNRA